MKHFANYCDVYPESVVSFVDATTVTTSDGSDPDRFNSFNNIELDENPETSAAGTKYTQQARVVTAEKMTDELKQKYGNNRPVVVVLYDDSGNPMVWGDKTYKVRQTIKSTLEHDIFDFSRESINPFL